MSAESKIEELASRFQEAHRTPDPYRFLIDADGDLFSPSHNCKVINTINTDHLVGQLEKKAFVAISRWVREESQGVIAWVSPPNPYPVSKLIISEIEYKDGYKRLFNRAIVLDINEEDCLELGRKLTRFSKEQPFFAGPADLRATPIVLDTTKFSWTTILERVNIDIKQIDDVKTGQDIISKKAAVQEAKMIFSMDYDKREVMITKMLGDKPESCPPRLVSTWGQTAVQIFSQNALTLRGEVSAVFSSNKSEWFCIKCPICGMQINSEVKPGESCPNPSCRAVRKCA